MQTVILAAGKGSRMQSDLPKALVPLKGQPMIKYLLDSVKECNFKEEPIIVVSPDNYQIIKEALKDYKVKYALQDKQLGTGHALACAESKADKNSKYVVCLYGDHPFISRKSILKIKNEVSSELAMMTVKIDNFFGWKKCFSHWGKIVREEGKVKEIIEYKDATEEEKKITEINPAFVCFSTKWLWKNIDKLKNNNAQKEYYLTDLVKIAFKNNVDIKTINLLPEEAMGVNSLEELKIAEKLLDGRKFI